MSGIAGRPYFHRPTLVSPIPLYHFRFPDSTMAVESCTGIRKTLWPYDEVTGSEVVGRKRNRYNRPAGDGKRSGTERNSGMSRDGA